MVKTVKNKFKHFRWKKIQWKKVLSATLAVLLVVGAIAGIAALASKDTKTISSFAFTRGSIDANGNSVKDNRSIYTEDLIECKGLTIEPDFAASGTYQVFYYDSNGSYLGATEKIDANDGKYERGNSFALAKYCRVLITPDDGGDEDFAVRFYNVTSYANDYTICVSKKQNFKLNNACVWDKSMNGKHWYVLEGKVVVSADAAYSSSKFIDVSSCDEIKIYVPVDVASDPHWLIFAAADETVIDWLHLNEDHDRELDGMYYIYTVSVPQNAERVVLSLCLEAASSYGIVLG